MTPWQEIVRLVGTRPFECVISLLMRTANEILAERAIGLERAVFQQFDYSTNNEYRSSEALDLFCASDVI
jgi:hypothetical protein